MKRLALFLPILVLVGLFSGCAKEEIQIPESEETATEATALKGAPDKSDWITIYKTLPNGNVIEITVPIHAVEQMIANTPKLSYSPEGVYLCEYRTLKPITPEIFDVFITSFNGTDLTGTYGFPAGGPYKYTGPIVNIDPPLEDPVTGYLMFTAWFVIDGQKELMFKFGTSESDGIIKDWAIHKDNKFLVLRTIPYSPEGYYEIREKVDPGVTPDQYFDFWVTSFDENNFTGKYVYKKSINGDVEQTGELEGNIFMKSDGMRFEMALHMIKEDIIITGLVHVEKGMTEFDDYVIVLSQLLIPSEVVE